MKKLLAIIFVIVLFGCKKEEDPTGKDYTVSFETRIWNTSQLNYTNLVDSARYQFFEIGSDSAFKTIYTGPDGKCSISLKGGKEYAFKVISASYRNSQGKVYYYFDNSSGFHSTRPNGAKQEANDFVVTFVFGSKGGQYNEGKGATYTVMQDPINY